ncbi:MAG: multicopper oxidase [Thermoanaerobacterales bacterium]|nr:multicopper oxidase [Thermoanaerobacterales bacterium]
MKERLDPTSIPKYVDPLPIPPVLRPRHRLFGIKHYTVKMRQVRQKLHRDTPPTTVWGYEGMYPGPTFEVRTNEIIKVKWINRLPIFRHLLPVDRTIHGAEPPNPRVRTVVHLHGGNVPARYDGHPEAWFTNRFLVTGPYFKNITYVYPNIQPATTLWYHDHALGITRLNVYAGLAGFYIVRDAYEDRLNLPHGPHEVPLVIQDRSFQRDGSLFYPARPEDAPPGARLPDPSIVPEFFGDTIVVNGKVWPYLEVEPRKYRLRFLNGSNSRFYRMRLSSGQPFYQIGTDQGFLDEPVPREELLFGPGERLDVIVDFSDFGNETITLLNDAPTPFPNGDPVKEGTTDQIMQFRVTIPLAGPDTSSLPSRLVPVIPLPEEAALNIRNLALVEDTDRFGRLMLMLDNKRWSDPITERPQLGTVEIWRLINTTPDTHPIHLHLVRFQVLDRQPFDVNAYRATGEIRHAGSVARPDAGEKGWKDTVLVHPGEATRIIARFGDFTGKYVWHCHILEHEDHEMMRPYEVVR